LSTPFPRPSRLTVERVAAEITSRLEVGRQQASIAARWPSAGPMMAEFDRLLVAFEKMVAAKRAGAGNPQAAFEEAGGVTAWTAMFEAGRAVIRPSGATVKQCPTVPVSP
jgi:hypothetical protein